MCLRFDTPILLQNMILESGEIGDFLEVHLDPIGTAPANPSYTSYSEHDDSDSN